MQMGPRAAGEARGEEARRGREKTRSFCGRDSVKRENASERGKKMLFIFLNEG